MKDISPRAVRYFRREYTEQYADMDSIEEVCALDGRVLERTAHVNHAILAERHGLNSRVVKLIRRKPTRDLAGYYILYPIGHECQALIEEGRILKSSQLTTEHICKTGAPAASLYLSMVYGAARASQAFLIYLLYRDIREMIGENRSLRSIFVRPVTPAGFRAVEKHEFQRFRLDSGIYRRMIDSQPFINEESH